MVRTDTDGKDGADEKCISHTLMFSVVQYDKYFGFEPIFLGGGGQKEVRTKKLFQVQ